MLLCQISDLHIKSRGENAYRVVDTAESLRRCVAHIGSLPTAPDAIVITGDLVEGGHADEYALLRELLAFEWRTVRLCHEDASPPSATRS